jgi:hypothetical protein
MSTQANLIVPASELKMIREALCVAQSMINHDGRGESRPYQSDMLQILIKEIDIHRPHAANGKHGKLHTETCGCEDVRP